MYNLEEMHVDILDTITKNVQSRRDACRYTGQYKNVSFKISLKSDMEESFIEPMVLCWSFNMGMQCTNSITKVKQTKKT
jgi:hypothetical protein